MLITKFQFLYQQTQKSTSTSPEIEHKHTKESLSINEANIQNFQRIFGLQENVVAGI